MTEQEITHRLPARPFSVPSDIRPRGVKFMMESGVETGQSEEQFWLKWQKMNPDEQETFFRQARDLHFAGGVISGIFLTVGTIKALFLEPKSWAMIWAFLQSCPLREHPRQERIKRLVLLAVVVFPAGFRHEPRHELPTVGGAAIPGPLEPAPEVFRRICMKQPVGIPSGMVYHVLQQQVIHDLIRPEFIRHQMGRFAILAAGQKVLDTSA